MKRLIEYWFELMKLRMHVRKIEALAKIHNVYTENHYFSKVVEGRIIEELSPVGKHVDKFDEDKFEEVLTGVLIEYKETDLGIMDAVERVLKSMKNGR